MSELYSDDFNSRSHYFDFPSLLEAGGPVVLAAVPLLAYMILPVVVSVERLFLANLITCFFISLSAFGYLAATAYATPALSLLPNRRRRSTRSLMVVALFQMGVLLCCSGIWYMMGIPAKNSPSLSQVVVGVLGAPLITFCATYLLLRFVAIRGAVMVLQVGVTMLFLPLILDSNSWQELLGAGILVSVGILLVRWQRRRKATREVGNVRLPARSHSFTNATSYGAYVQWSMQELFRGLPFSLMAVFVDTSATNWVARRFRPRLDSFGMGYEILFRHIGLGVTILVISLTNQALEPLIGIQIPPVLLFIIQGQLIAQLFFRNMSDQIFEQAQRDQAPNPLARRAGTVEVIGALAMLTFLAIIFLPLTIKLPTSIVLWSILLFFIGLYVFLLRRYAQKWRIERLNGDWR